MLAEGAGTVATGSLTGGALGATAVGVAAVAPASVACASSGVEDKAMTAATAVIAGRIMVRSCFMPDQHPDTAQGSLSSDEQR